MTDGKLGQGDMMRRISTRTTVEIEHRFTDQHGVEWLIGLSSDSREPELIKVSDIRDLFVKV